MRMRYHGEPVYEISVGERRSTTMLFATYADGAVGLRRGHCGFFYLNREEITQVRVRRDGISFRVRSGAWYRAHFPPDQIERATEELARVGLQVDQAA